MRKLELLAPIVALSLAAAPVRAGTEAFHVSLDGLAAFPVGTLAGGRSAADAMDTGFGLKAEVLYDLAPAARAGIAIAGIFDDAEALVGPARVPADLTAIPVHAVFELHTPRRARFGAYGEAGFGMTAATLRPKGLGAAETRSQTAFSFLAGGGLSLEVAGDWQARVGALYEQAVTGEGEVWAKGDDPKFVLLTLGAHFHR
ncbi:MAG: outer membrane beta-barrel protein [Candidatus Eisenbacteria bacterium]|nr:outer membrane beta-barrel protein [Candidatus Eisenbacteria bacterium]